MMEIDKAYIELIKQYPGLKKPGCWIDSHGDIHIIRNMEAQYIQNVIKELNKQFRAYCTRNNDGEFVGKSAESIKKKLDELQEALDNTKNLRAIDYSKKQFWTVELLEETLKYYTVLKPNEYGDFDLLWQAKLDCEKTIGGVIRPA